MQSSASPPFLGPAKLVAQVVAPGSVGGVETVVAQLLSAASKAHLPMVCLALLPDGAELPTAFSRLHAEGVSFVRIPTERRNYRAQYRALREAIRSLDIGVVHSHGYHADVIAGLAARAERRKHMSTLHGFIGATLKSRLYEWLQLRTLRRAAAVIAVSESIATRATASGISKSRLCRIVNAVPNTSVLSRGAASERLGLPRNARVLGWVGRMSAEKQPLAFVMLLDELRAQDELVGVMLGDGALMADVKSRGAALLADGRLCLPGVVSNAGELLQALDALVITSSTEGTPMVALEAMRAGVPVVSTAVGGVPQMLEGGAGVTVPYGDRPAMRAATLRILGDASFASSLRQAGLLRVAERYSGEKWWAQHRVMYEDLASVLVSLS